MYVSSTYTESTNSSTGTLYTRYYAGNDSWDSSTGHATTSTYAYGYVLYVSPTSGSLSCTGGCT